MRSAVATQSAEGRTTGERVEKGDWTREVWFWQLSLLRHPVQSSAAVEYFTVTEDSAGESVQSHVVLS